MTRIRSTYLAVIAVLLSPIAAQATVIYTYTGNTFTDIVDTNPPAGVYDTTMSVSGTFTVAAPLVSLAPLTDITASVLSFSFFDGRFLMESDTTTVPRFLITTDSAGAVLDWDIILIEPFPRPTSVGDFSMTMRTKDDIDFGRLDRCNAIQSIFVRVCNSGTTLDLGRNNFSQGTWAITIVAVPEPPAALLLGSGLLALFGFARAGRCRRRRD